MLDKNIRWIAVNPDGIISGPCMKTENECIYALVVGYRRTIGRDLPKRTVNEDWENIKRLGYSVKKCRIHIL